MKVSVSDSTSTILDMLNDPRTWEGIRIIGINIRKGVECRYSLMLMHFPV